MLISSEAWSPQEQECLGSERDAKGPGEAQRQTALGMGAEMQIPHPLPALPALEAETPVSHQ